MTPKQKLALLILNVAVLESIPEEGAPSGALYAALMTKGMSLENYQALLNGLQGAGAIRATSTWIGRGPDYAKCLRGVQAMLEMFKTGGAA